MIEGKFYNCEIQLVERNQQIVALQPKVSFKDEVKNIMKYFIYHVIFENVTTTNHALLERF